MKKNDITYEYRVFTSRPVDIETMEVGRCTSKVIKELKSKDKVEGRFFHTSDTDEWFFCWNGELQKLDLKGSADVNAALEEVNRLIDEANTAVSNANAAATKAEEISNTATAAAEAATKAVENIGGVETTANEAKELANEVKTAVETKAEQSSVDALSDRVDGIVIPSLEGYATEEFVTNKIAEAELNDKDVDLSGYATKEDIANFITKDEVPSVEGLASEQYVIDRINEINIPSVSGLATTEYVDEKVTAIKIPSIDNLATKEETEGVKTWVGEQGFLKEHQDLSEYAKKSEIPSVDGLATETFVSEEIGKIVIPEVPSLDGYALKSEIPSLEGYAKISDIPSLDEYAKKSDIPEVPSMENYFTKDEINKMFGEITDLIGDATALTDTILNA